MGTEFIRGVSGGEAKRTNIGMELITEPQVLFLDEPTTGLDAFTAISVVQLLKKWEHIERERERERERSHADIQTETKRQEDK